MWGEQREQRGEGWVGHRLDWGILACFLFVRLIYPRGDGGQAVGSQSLESGRGLTGDIHKLVICFGVNTLFKTLKLHRLLKDQDLGNSAGKASQLHISE